MVFFDETIISEKERLGLFVKYIRKKKRFSLENLSVDLEIPKSTLGEFERGKRKMNLEVFLAFLNYYQINFLLDSAQYDHIIHILNNGISAFISNDLQLQDQFQESFEALSYRYTFDLGLFYYLLCELLFFHCNHESDKVIKLGNDLLSYQIMYAKDHYALIQLITGINLKKTGQLKRSLELLESAEITVEGTLLPELPGIIKYFLVYPLGIMKSYILGLSKGEEAKSLLVKSNCTFRVPLVIANQAILLGEMEYYPEAINLLNRSLSVLKRTAPGVESRKVTMNLIILNALAGNYDESLKLINKNQQESKDQLGNFIFTPYCYIFLNDFDCARKYIYLFRTNSLDRIDKTFLELMSAYLNKNENKLIHLFFKLVKLFECNHDCLSLYPGINLLEKYYSENNSRIDVAKLRELRLKLRSNMFQWDFKNFNELEF